jgi:hypothetical protein
MLVPEELFKRYLWAPTLFDLEDRTLCFERVRVSNENEKE